MGRLIFSPFRGTRVASRDSPCRRSRTARKNYGTDRARWLSNQRSRGCRRLQGRREIRKWYGRAGSGRNRERRRGRGGERRFPAARTPQRSARKFSVFVLRWRRKSGEPREKARWLISARPRDPFDRRATFR